MKKAISIIGLKLFISLVAIILSNTPTLGQAPYCGGSAVLGCATDRICSVTLSGCQTLNNVQLAGQECSAVGYQNYTTMQSPRVCAGGQIQAQIQTVCCNGPGCPPEFTQFMAAWIDFNQDLDFNDPGEFISATPAPLAIWNFTIPIPSTAACGDTRLRIRTRWLGPPFIAMQACGNILDWGETEDYTITIINIPPPNNASFSFCQGQAQDITLVPNNCVNTGNVTFRWYDAAVGGNLLNTGNTYTPNFPVGVHFLWVSHYDATCGCESPRTPISVTILTAPPALNLSSNAPLCSSSTLQLTATGAIGTVSWSGPNNWTATGSNVSRTPAVGGAYSAFQTAPNGCISPIATIEPQIIPAPAQPIALNQSRCGQGVVTFPVAMGNPAGHGVLLYVNAVGGAPIQVDYITPFYLSTPTITTNTTFYIAARDTIFQCESTRLAVEANILPLPALPIVDPLSRCGSGSVTLTVVGPVLGQQVLVYNQLNASNPILTANTPPYAIVTPTLSQNTTLYVEVLDANGCYSGKVAVPITIHSKPGIPFSQDVSRCGAGGVTFTVLLDSFIPGDEVLLYTMPSGGLPVANSLGTPYLLSTPAIAQSQIWYIASRNTQNGCESSRLPVAAQILPIPGAPNIPNIERCGSGNLIFTAAFQAPVGNIIQMYTQPAGGFPIQAANGTGYGSVEFVITLHTTSVYYFEVVNTFGCVSSRVSATATIHPLPEAPTVPKVVRCGAGSVTFTPTPAAINGGDAFFLYSQATGGVPIVNSTILPYTLNVPFLSTTQTFWVASQNTATGCQSNRVEAIAEVIALPSPPIASSQSRCGGGDINFIVNMGLEPGNQIQIWDALVGGNLIAQSNTFPYSFTLNVANTSTYYLQSVKHPSGCQSERRAIEIKIHPLPQRPAFLVSSRCGAGIVTITALPQNPAQEKVQLFTLPVGGNAIYEANTPLFILQTPFLGNTSDFYIAAVNKETGCSSARAAVTANILTIPSQPNVSNAVSCNGEPILLPVTMGSIPGDYVALYTVATGGLPIATQSTAPYVLATPAITTHTTFYVSVGHLGSNCESPRKIVIVERASKPAIPQVISASRCGAGEVVFTAFMGNPAGNTIRVYDQAVGGNIVAFSNTSPYLLNIPAVTSTTPYWFSAYNTQTGCESERISSLAMIYLPPAAPLSADVARCGMGPIKIEAQMGSPSGNEIRLFTEPVGGIPIAVDNFAPFTFSMFLPISQLFYLESRNTITGCVSLRTPVAATIHPLPEAPFVPSVFICGNGSVTFTPIVSPLQANEVRLYESEAGNLLAKDDILPFELPTPTLGTTTTFYVAAYNSATGCEGPRSPAVAQLAPIPGKPVTQDVLICGPGTATVAAISGIPAGNLLELYDMPAGGTLIATALPGQLIQLPSIAVTTTYYWQSKHTPTQCVSERTPVVIEVKSLPQAPVISNISRCGPGAITLAPTFIPTAGSELWLYTQSNGGNAIAKVTQAPYEIRLEVSQTQTYYLAHYNFQTGCQSARVPVEIYVFPTPPLPRVERVISSCVPSVLTFTVQINSSGGDWKVRLYDQAQGGNIIAMSITPPHLLSTPYLTNSQTYYVSITDALGQCEGPRVAVEGQILPSLPMPAVENEKRCGKGPITFFPNSLQPAVRLYSAEAGGTLLAEDRTPPFELTVSELEPSANPYTYYVTAYNPQNGCESQRVAVTATVYELPLPPVVENVSRCGSGEVVFTGVINNPTQKVMQVYSQLPLQNPIASIASSPFIWKTPTVSTTTAFYFTTYDWQSGCQSIAQPAIATIHSVPAPVLVADVLRCGPGNVTFTARMMQPAGTEIRMYTQVAGGNPMHTASAFPYLFPVNDLVISTRFYFAAYDANTGCEGERVEATAQVTSRPVVPTFSVIPTCGEGNVTISVLAPGASSVALFYEATGSQIAAIDYNEPFVLLTPYQTTTTTYYISVLADNGCESERQVVIAPVFANPPMPVVEPVRRCGVGAITFTVSSVLPGLEVAAFSTLVGGEPIAATQSFPYELEISQVLTNTTYYIGVRNPNTGCSSPRQMAVVNIDPLPQALPAMRVSRCGGGTLNFTVTPEVALGNSVLLFATSTGGVALSSDDNFPFILETPNISESSTFYLEVQNVQTGCRSLRSPVIVDILALPGMPLVPSVKACAGQNVTFSANFTYPVGNQILMYHQSGANLPVEVKAAPPFTFSTPTLQTSTTYYFSARNSITGCESPKVEAVANISLIPPPPTVTNVSRCGAGSITINALAALPGNYVANAYASIDATIPVAQKANPPYELFIPFVGSNTTYFINFQDNLSQCEGPRVPVRVNILPVPPRPILRDAFRCGAGDMRLSLVGNMPLGVIVRLFDEEVGGTQIAQASAEPYILDIPHLSQSSTFYAEAVDVLTGCRSERLPVIAEVKDLPGTPVVENASVCAGRNAIIAAAMGNPAGHSLRLYLASNAAAPIDEKNQAPYVLNGPRIEQSTTYYVASVSLEGCESPRVAVSVNVQPTPASPQVVLPVQRCGAGSVVVTARMSNPAGDKVAIYTQSEGGIEIASAEVQPYHLVLPNVTQSQVYFIESIATQAGCTSARVPFSVQILPPPGFPVAEAVQRCGAGEVQLSVHMTSPRGTAIRLFDAPWGGNLIAQTTQHPAIITLSNVSQSTTYYLESYQASNGCTSRREAVSISIFPLPEPPAVSEITLCGRGIVTFSPVLQGGDLQVRLYESPLGGRLLAQTTIAPYVINTPIISQSQIFGISVKDNTTGCESPRVPAKVEVVSIPAAPRSIQAVRCGVGKVVFTITQPLEPNQKVELYSTSQGGEPLAEMQVPSQIITTPELQTTTTFYIQIANLPSGCASERVPAVATIHPVPNVPIVANVTRCGSGQIQLTVGGLSANEMARLFTEPTASLIIAETRTAPYILNTPVLNTDTWFYVEAQNSLGCTSQRVPVQVKILPIPAPPVIINDSPKCTGQTISLEATSNPGSSFLWSGPNSFTATQALVTLANATLSHQGSYSVVAILSGCTSAISSTQVRVLPGLVAPVAVAYSDFSRNRAFCQGEELNLAIANFADFPNNTSFYWSGPAGFQSNSPSPVIESLTLSNQGVYTVYAVAQGCTSQSGSVEVTVNPRPLTPTILANAPVCLGQTFTLTATGVPDVSRYHWWGPNGWEASEQVVSRLAQENTAGVYSLVAISAMGCTSSVATQNVAFWALPRQPEVSHNAPLCQGSTLMLNISGGNHYYLEAPTFSQSIQLSSFSRSNMQLQDAGIYKIIAVANGCTSLPTQFEVGVNRLPLPPTANVRVPICEGATIRLAAEHPEGASEFIWVGPNNFFAKGQQVTIENAAPFHSGIYQVRAIVSGCTSEAATVNVLVNLRPPAPIIESSDAVCVGGIFFMTIINADPNLEYRWWGPAQFTAAGNQVSRTNVTIDYAGLYQAVAIQNGCSSEISSISIEVRPLPAPPRVYNNGPKCAGESALVWADIAPQAQYIWMGPGGFMSTERTISITSLTAENAGVYSLLFIQNGCAAPIVSTTLVLKPTPPVPVVGSDSPRCVGQNLLLSASSTANEVSYIWQGPAGFRQITTNTTIRITNATTAMAGIYTVTAVSNGCTSAPATVNVNIQSIPPTPFIRHNSPICEGSNLQLWVESAPGITYEWSGPQGFNAIGAVVNRVPALVQHSGTYRVIANNNGCRSTAATVNITINALPQAPILSSNAPICTNQLLQLTAIAPIGSVVHWQGPNGFTAQGSIASRWVSSTSESGNYSAFAISGSCTSARANLVVDVISAEEAPQIGANSPLCEGQTLSLSTQAIAGAIYHWRGPSGFSSTLQNPQIFNITTTHAGTYQLHLQIGNCFTPSALVNVTIRPTPAPTVALANAPLCEGQVLRLTATDVPRASYIWSGPGGFMSTSQYPIIPNVTTANAGVYNVYAVQGPCTSAASIVGVQIFRTPAAPTLLNNSPICSGQTLHLTAGIQPNVFYHWRGPNGFFASIPNPYIENVTTDASGIYSLQVSMGSCTSEVRTTVVEVISTPPTPEISSNSPICEGSNLQLLAKPMPGLRYAWQGPAGFYSLEPTPFITNASSIYAGEYSLVVSAGNCSSALATTQVTILPKPRSISITHNAPLCAGQTLNLTAPELPNALYYWSGPGGFQSGLRVVQISNIQVEQSGIYSLYVQVGNCRSEVVTAAIEVLPAPGSITATANTPICQGQTLQLQATLINEAQYEWQGPAGYQSFMHSPAIPAITTAQSGTYSVIAYIGQCTSNLARINVSVLPSPMAVEINGERIACEGQTVTLGALSSEGATFEWRGPSNFVSQRQNITLSNIVPEMAGTYSVIAKLGNCASEVATATIEVVPLPQIISVKRSEASCLGGRLELDAIATPGSSLIWKGPNGFSSNASRPVIELLNMNHSGSYSVQAVQRGCTSRA
ncbi:MAG: GEVED domain-containing protein, partial [Bacteroidia bacterium]|nr:GEVED domain-containing protein [Bacteroidia bacterium]